jgi:hypothetical protein
MQQLLEKIIKNEFNANNTIIEKILKQIEINFEK